MKIKELHLRNIASIEAADIDFEKGLVDGVTGAPASIFLIAGDTGAGKSVILDGIAMALYKTTPRIDGVANTRNNEFVSPAGETVSISNISQYTRMGISEKDDCYSELRFEGNDGLEYCARLTLGVMLGQKNEQGIRPMKYRSPEWTLSVSNGTSYSKVGEIESVIRQAVGLDFEQFQRMAMLAQGQFATFLTGKKEEREIVLEQLTNTQRFSEFGEAIERLFKKVKDQKKLVEARRKEAESNVLSSFDMTELNDTISQLEGEKQSLEKDSAANRQRLNEVTNIEKAEHDRQTSEQEIQRLNDLQQSDAFKQQKTLFTDWDNTNEERQQLTFAHQAERQKKEAESKLSALKNQFDTYSSDLEWQTQKAEQQSVELEKQQQWLSERGNRDALFTNHGQWEEKMKQLAQNIEKQANNKKQLDVKQGQTESLQQQKNEAQSVLEKANAAVNEKQKSIDELTEVRKALNPEGINAQLTQTQERKNKFQKLQEALTQWSEKQSVAEKTKQEIGLDETRLGDFEKQMQQSKAAYEAAKEADDNAKQRLTTMQMSVKQTIVELRKRLQTEHTEICPLCGQSIDQHALDQDFQNVLTPLEAEQKQTAEALQNAERQYRTDNDTYQKASGELANKKKSLSEQERDISEQKRKLDNEAMTLGLDDKHDFAPQITKAIGDLETEIERLKKSQKDAEDLQTQINERLTEKKPLDAEKSKAETASNAANNAVARNADEIRDLQKQMEELKKDIDALESEISNAVSVFYKDWHLDLKETIVQLNRDAVDYLDKKAKFEKDKAALENKRETLKSIRQTRVSILEKQPQWNANVTATEQLLSNRHTLWSNLFAEVSSATGSINKADKDITEAQIKLEAYYARAGKTQQDLETLMAQEQQVSEARKYVQNIEADLKSRNDDLLKAKQQIEEAMLKIGATSREEVPQKALLEETDKSLNEKLHDCVGVLAQKKQQRADYLDFEKHLKEIDNELAVIDANYRKWEKLNKYFGGSRFRTRVQTYILRPLLNNANLYLEQITDRYRLTCSEDNEQLSILVHDRYNKDQIRSATVLSGGERFMISLALSLALSSLNRPDLNVNILFIDEGFGTLDRDSLESVMGTLEKLQEIAGQSQRRVGIISHREELDERIPVKIKVEKRGQGRSQVRIENSI